MLPLPIQHRIREIMREKYDAEIDGTWVPKSSLVWDAVFVEPNGEHPGEHKATYHVSATTDETGFTYHVSQLIDGGHEDIKIGDA